MLTGTLPFTATSIQEAITKRLTEQPRRLSDAEPGQHRSFPEPLERALNQALERKSGDRYPSVTAFAEAVAAAARAPRRAPDRPLARTELVPERPRRWRAAIIAGSGLAVAAIGYAGWRFTRDPAARPVEVRVDSTVIGAAPPPVAPPGPAPAGPATKPASATPIPPPPPAPTAATRTDTTLASTGAGADTIGLPGIPTLGDFDEPRSPRARRAAFTAARLAQDKRVADPVRAEMAWFVGQHWLDLGNKVAAARAFRHSCRLQHADRCGRMLQQLENVP